MSDHEAPGDGTPQNANPENPNPENANDPVRPEPVAAAVTPDQETPPLASDEVSGAEPAAPVAPREGVAARRGDTVLVRAAAAAVLVLSIGAMGFVLGHWVDRATAPTYAYPATPGQGGSITIPGYGSFPLPDYGSGTGAPGSAAIKANPKGARIAKKVDPGLVDVTSTYQYAGATGEGTGMVLTKNGLVLTNNHVIEGASSVTVRDVATNTSYAATVVGYDVSADIAVLQLQGASGLPTVSFATSTPSVGDAVLGVGNAGGLGGTPSYAAGKVVALNQTITARDENNPSGSETLSGLIEFDADIQPGDSGGALVNAKGRVIGIDTAGAATNGGFGFAPAGTTSQGYAIPIATALGIAHDIENGAASASVHVGGTAFLGILVDGARPGNTTSGVTIAQVLPNGPATQGGLVAGDTITSLGGITVANGAQLQSAMLTFHVGQTITVNYTTPGGTTGNATVTLGSGPAQ